MQFQRVRFPSTLVIVMLEKVFMLANLFRKLLVHGSGFRVGGRFILQVES
jgi:hypothetical protein